MHSHGTGNRDGEACTYVRTHALKTLSACRGDTTLRDEATGPKSNSKHVLTYVGAYVRMCITCRGGWRGVRTYVGMRSTRKSLRSDFVECGSLLLDVWRQVLEAAAKRNRDDGLMRLVLKAQAKATATEQEQRQQERRCVEPPRRKRRQPWQPVQRSVRCFLQTSEIRDRACMHGQAFNSFLKRWRCKAQNFDRTVPRIRTVYIGGRLAEVEGGDTYER